MRVHYEQFAATTSLGSRTSDSKPGTPGQYLPVVGGQYLPVVGG